MQYHVAKNGEKSGPFSREEVYHRLTVGDLSGTDLGWHEGLADWQPLSQLIPPAPAPAAGLSSPPVFGSTPAPSVGTLPAGSTSGAAVASLVCGILGFFLCLPALPAVILGHIGLSSIKKSAGTLKGRGLAVGGLVTGYLALGLGAIAMLASLAVPAFNSVQNQGNQAKAVSNAKQLILGMKQYARDHNGSMPPTLETLFEKQYVTERRLLDVPGTITPAGQGWQYLGAGTNDAAPGNTILLISAKADRTRKKIVAFADGSVEVLRESEIERLEP